jgi:hypothetical protein
VSTSFRNADYALVDRRRIALTQLWRNLALHDFAILGVNSIAAALALVAASGPSAQLARRQSLGLFALSVTIIVLTRAELIRSVTLRAAIYRLGTLGAMLGSYLVLRTVLPALHPQLLDRQLITIDRLLFGKMPAEWLDPLVNPRSVEWFAFFYYSHYWLLASYLLGTLFFDSGRRQYEFLLAIALIAAIGHSTYPLVPGRGPYACDWLTFQHPLVGGVWWARVQATVAAAGAGLDIFPSLHTAFALMIGAHAFRHRRQWPFVFAWLPTCFCVANIVIATVFLRWHHGIDVLAGALLAIGAHRFAINSWPHEQERLARGDRQPAWEPVLPQEMDVSDRRWLIGVTLMQLGALGLLLAI